jgi:hypothetical protein
MSSPLTVGTLIRHRDTGRIRIVVRITPAGANGTRVSDGPTYHARVVDDACQEIPGGHVADIWTGSLSYPLADWQTLDTASSASRQWWIESGQYLGDGDECGCTDHAGIHRV